MMLDTFLARVSPASTRAKPACMKITRIAATNTQMLSRVACTPSAIGSSGTSSWASAGALSARTPNAARPTHTVSFLLIDAPLIRTRPERRVPEQSLTVRTARFGVIGQRLPRGVSWLTGVGPLQVQPHGAALGRALRADGGPARVGRRGGNPPRRRRGDRDRAPGVSAADARPDHDRVRRDRARRVLAHRRGVLRGPRTLLAERGGERQAFLNGGASGSRTRPGRRHVRGRRAPRAALRVEARVATAVGAPRRRAPSLLAAADAGSAPAARWSGPRRWPWPPDPIRRGLRRVRAPDRCRGHARPAARGADRRRPIPGAGVVAGRLASGRLLRPVRRMASAANEIGRALDQRLEPTATPTSSRSSTRSTRWWRGSRPASSA